MKTFHKIVIGFATFLFAYLRWLRPWQLR